MAFRSEPVHRSVMAPGERSQPRTRPAPTAQCRLCSATATIEASSTDQLRIRLRRFMAEHRHEGLADIVIDIRDEVGEGEDEDDGAMDTEASVSRL